MSTLDPDTMTVTVPVRLAIESAGKKRERTIDLAYDSIKDKL